MTKMQTTMTHGVFENDKCIKIEYVLPEFIDYILETSKGVLLQRCNVVSFFGQTI